MNTIARSLLALAAVICYATPALAGPPLICFPFEVESGKLIAWGTGPGWNTPDRSYDINKVIADTNAILATDAPVTDVWRLHGAGHFKETVPVLDATGQMTYGSEVVPGSGPVELSVHGVSFAYPGAAPVLRNVTFDVAPGRTVALVGLTGSGKSSLASLLVRLVDPDDGSVRQ